jgi:hypothetical protein
VRVLDLTTSLQANKIEWRAASALFNPDVSSQTAEVVPKEGSSQVAEVISSEAEAGKA